MPCNALQVIATMAKSFDMIYESLDVNAMFVKAKLSQTAARLPLAPSPFNLLGLPARAIDALRSTQRFAKFLRVRPPVCPPFPALPGLPRLLLWLNLRCTKAVVNEG